MQFDCVEAITSCKTFWDISVNKSKSDQLLALNLNVRGPSKLLDFIFCLNQISWQPTENISVSKETLKDDTLKISSLITEYHIFKVLI